MGIEKMIDQLPDYAFNVGNLMKEVLNSDDVGLGRKQILGIMLTAGYALKNECLLNFIRSDAKKILDQNEANACKIAVCTMSMTNTYHNFAQNLKNMSIKRLPLELKVNQMLHNDVSRIDFTLYCLAASIINNCKYCINSHIEKLRDLRVKEETIDHIAKIVAVTKASGDVLDIERVRSFDFLIREENF